MESVALNETIFLRYNEAVPKTAPAARNRFIYHGNQLNKMPSSLSEILTNRPPVLKGVISGILAEPFVRKGELDDETIHAFITRRFGKPAAENLVSAIM